MDAPSATSQDRDTLGEVIAVFKIMPESPETDHDGLLEQVTSLVPEGVTLESHEAEPVAFGLEALMVTVRMPDSEDISADDMETSFSKIEGVESVSISDVGRV